ncbi:MAG: cytochrome P450 [Actinomycetota bacterium]
MNADVWDLDIDVFGDSAVGDVRDPYPEFHRLQKLGPINFVEVFGHPVMFAHRYDDVNRILSDNETFSSTVFKDSIAMVFGPTILAMDGHEHQAHRGLVASAFRLKALEDWKTKLIEPITHELIDAFIERGDADLVREFNFRFPIQVIANMLGVPSEDSGLFLRRSIEMISIAVNVERGLAASAALKDYLAPIVAERREEPKDDLISVLATAEVDGVRLPDENIYGFLRLLLPAGAETTYRLLGNVLFGLLTNPDQLEEVREDRDLVPDAIEEALRWEAPVQQTARIVMTDGIDVGGFPLRKGDSLNVSMGAANRDETTYEDPDRYNIHREGPPHLAFGGGAHYCLGAHLGRLETSVALNAMLDRLGDLRLVPGDKDPHVHGSAFRSPTSLPVRFVGRG